MSTEQLLFIIIGAISLASAASMILSTNAVHSALFLILNLVSVAFLFLLLEAPFLAMVQIAVYAGAIMVLFLFVIMLLGAEQVGPSSTDRYRWMTPLGVTLSTVLFAAMAYGVKQGEIKFVPPVQNQPLLEVVHAATDAGVVDVYVDGELFAAGIAPLEQNIEFSQVAPGEHTVTLTATGATTPLAETSVTLAMNEATALVASGQGTALTFATLPVDLSQQTERTEGRITVYNAFSDIPAISLVDLGDNRRIDTDVQTDELTDTVLLADIAQDSASNVLTLQEGAITTWAFVDAANPTTVLYRLNDPVTFDVGRDTSNLLVFADERITPDTVRARALFVKNRSNPAFGGPVAVGELLFTKYLLPFELVSALLLVAMVGAILLTQRVSVPAAKRVRPGTRTRHVVSRPLIAVVAAQTGQESLAGAPTASVAKATDGKSNGAAEMEEGAPALDAQPEPAGD